MKRVGFALVLVSSVALVVSAFGHALAGWPPLYASLVRTDADTEVVRALWAGWHFGSAAMLAFGAITVSAVVRSRRGDAPSPVPLIVIAVALVGFGAVASFVVGVSSHFLGFVVVGVLLGFGVLLR